MSRKNKNIVIDCDITEMDTKGNGLGYYNDTPVEVPHTIPGDQVRIKLLRKRKGKYGCLKEFFVKESPDRIMPRCQHFGTCGGCQWQHIPYDRQLKIKEQGLAELFSDYDIKPIIPCEDPWHYRNKMEFSFSQNKAGEKFLGLMMPKSRGRVVNLEECHLCPKWFLQALSAVNNWWNESDLFAYHAPSNNGSLRNITMRTSTDTNIIILTVSGNPDYALKRHHLDSFVAALKDIPNLGIYLQIQQICKNTPTQFYEMHLTGPRNMYETITVGDQSYSFKISPPSFFQTNYRQMEKLYASAFELAEIPPDSIVWDLYCGTATLGIFASKHAKKIIGIEITPEAVLDATSNIDYNKIDNIEVFEGDVGTLLKEKELPHPDVVIVDPPRAGLDPKTISQLLAVVPEKILYISCNPKTQADDIKNLEGYSVVALQPVDMFPFTPHIENIAILRRT